MSDRKPPGVRFETWIDRQIRRATERGEFENLPGAGRPIPDLARPYDEMWWVKQKLRREKLTYLPPSLALRKEVHDTLAALPEARTEAEVRETVGRLNRTIAEANRLPRRGPPLSVGRLDVERVVRGWRRARRR